MCELIVGNDFIVIVFNELRIDIIFIKFWRRLHVVSYEQQWKWKNVRTKYDVDMCFDWSVRMENSKLGAFIQFTPVSIAILESNSYFLIFVRFGVSIYNNHMLMLYNVIVGAPPNRSTSGGPMPMNILSR